MTALTGRKPKYTGWTFAAAFLAIVAALPYLPVFAGFIAGGDAWGHVRDTVLLRYVANTIVLVAGTIVGAGMIGVTSAWVLYRYDLPRRGILEVLLLTPIALPVYVATFTWDGILSYGGVVFRVFGSTVPFAGVPAAIFILSVGLYPYVFLTVGAALRKESQVLFEVVASLSEGDGEGGGARLRHLRRVFRGVLPTLRPAIVGGLTLVAMEVLNAYATPVYLGIETLSTGVFRTWFSLGDLPSATRLAALVLLLVFALLFTERVARGRKRYTPGGIGAPLRPRPVAQPYATLVAGAIVLPPLFGFIIPVAQLIWWSVGAGVAFQGMLVTTGRTIGLAAIATVCIVVIAIVINFAVYLRPNRGVRILRWIGGIGYAVPGTVIAIGVLSVFRQLRLIDERLFLFGTVGGLLFAYTGRFLAVALQPIRGAFERTHTSVVDAARSLGSPPTRVLRRVVLPIFRPTLFGAALLVAIDVMKDIPMTLLLRPFDFSTLAVEVYRLASDERLPEAAPRALLLVAIGILTISVIMKSSMRRGDRR